MKRRAGGGRGERARRRAQLTDLTSTGQTTELQKVIRVYISRRLGPTPQALPLLDAEAAATRDEPSGAADPAQGPPALPYGHIETLPGTAVPQPDGHGGLIVSDADPEDKEAEEQVEARLAFPEGEGADGDVEMQEPASHELPNGDEQSQGVSGDVATSERPNMLLPEIGRLTREIVRNGEEKVALAVGAYNAVSRCGSNARLVTVAETSSD